MEKLDTYPKEQRKHGMDLMPIAFYEMSAQWLAEMRIECHWHEEWEFFILRSGMANINVNGNHFTLKEGEMAFWSGGCLHTVETNGGSTYHFSAMVVHPRLFGSSGDAANLKYISPLLTKKGQRWAVLDRNKSVKTIELFDNLLKLNVYKPPLYELRTKANLCELFATFLENSKMQYNETDITMHSDLMKQSIDYIRSNLCSEISVSSLAADAGMSEGHFSRLFKKHTGRPPIDYVMHLRLDKAAGEISTSAKPFLDIALECGFNSPSYFTRVFNRVYGCSPSQYRHRQNQYTNIN